MKIKKYVVREMQEAIRLIKEDLGPEAVIVSSYRLPPRSLLDFFRPRLLEVTAAVDEVREVYITVPAEAVDKEGEKEEYALSSGRSALRAGGVLDVRRTRPLRNQYGGLDVERPGISFTSLPAAGKLPEFEPRPLLQLPGGEPHSLFSIILTEQGEKMVEQEFIARWRRMLLDMEIQESIVSSLLADVPPEILRESEEQEELFKVTLKSRIAKLVEPVYQPRKETGEGASNIPRIYTFIGPTGVGKTTSLAKLATREKVLQKKNIVLIAVYSHRFGVVEELKFYGEMLKVPVEVVMTPAELAAAVEQHRDKDLVFIDTEGIPSHNTSQMLKLKSFLEAVPEEQEIFLVLSCTTKARDVLRITNDFQKVGFTRFIFTKLDETETYGSILNVVCWTGVPAAYVTNGQNVPDDIVPVQPRMLAALLVKGVGQDGNQVLL